ncbi:MAG TPA: adenosylcobalamin-dependent ribonucleoside-diphosphate reductase [Candidatus Nanoarchaeia archaeon]|nr:adenosylcobalamin-dependent ribonucleoside-diphosphate reductase [Candidatus Nanoarchaeia archaeon]
MIKKVRKRDGTVVLFSREKIRSAVQKALDATKVRERKLADSIADKVVEILQKKFGESIPSVEEIQDAVEEVLIHKDLQKTAAAYVLYREKHRKVREETVPHVRLESRLSVNALKVLQRRYLKRDDDGYIIETPDQMFRRVARSIAAVDKMYKGDVATSEEEFYEMMSGLEFLPNSPTLMNAGVKEELGLSACYVLPVPDSLVGIFDALKYQALIHQGGGGTGFSFSRLRPKGDGVSSSKGVASGPVSFMKIFDASTAVIKAGGRRRGANMAVLRVDHPDIEEFIDVKRTRGVLENFNISVGVTNEFMGAVLKNKDYALINPRTKLIVKKIKAREMWSRLVESAWLTGDPGLIFLDEINKCNKIIESEIEATNPCGEQPLLPFESCVLGSINLVRMVEKREIDWDKLRKTVWRGLHFLENVVDANKLPLKEVEEVTKANRRVGLGVMGWAEVLMLLGVPYDSGEALSLAGKVMAFVQKEAFAASQDLGKKRGSFPNFSKSVWRKKCKALRNVAMTTIAPTGTLSILASCSSGIEPCFGLSFVREVMEGTRLREVNAAFEKIAREEKFYSEKLMAQLARTGSVKRLRIPKKFKKIFVTAREISPEWHVRMQAAFQKYTDNAVSKTINLPKNAKVRDVERAFLLAYKLRCKGITVFRDGCKGKQVLYAGKMPSEFAGGCPGRECEH